MFSRSSDHTWWGFQEDEIKQRVLPCLNQSQNYWVQYQYIATVYSHDRTIWPGMYAPKVYATPKPWRMLCNPGKTVCIISLACRNCTNVLGWEDQCSLWYQDQAWRFVQGAAWVNVTGTWVRSVPLHGGCSLFESQSGKNNPKPRNLPYTGHGLIQLAEGHAWRRSLCLGQEIKGYEWLGPNSIYNNGTCESPAEHRLLCGQGENQHECHWYEVTGSIIITAVIRGVVKTVGAVLNGAKALGNWILAQIWSLFKCVWPALVIFLCVLFGVLTFFIL